MTDARPDIFFSHATANDEIVTRIHDELEARTGKSIWVDHHDLAPGTDDKLGDESTAEVERHIKRCPKFLMAISKELRFNRGGRALIVEWRAALDDNHPMLLAIIDREYIEYIPSRLRLIQQVDLSTDWEAGITTLADAIMGRHSESEADAQSSPVRWMVLNEIESALTGHEIKTMISEMEESNANGQMAAALLSYLLPCRGGFTLDAAKELWGFVRPEELNNFLNMLNTLMAWHFLTYDASRQRYAFDPAVFTAVDAGDLAVDSDKSWQHWYYYFKLAWSYEESQDYAGIELEMGNLEAAFEWAMSDVDNYSNALDLFRAVEAYFVNRGQYEKRLAWIERLARVIENCPDETVRGAVYSDLGDAYVKHQPSELRANLHLAIPAYEAALRYFTPDVSPMDYAATHNNLGAVYTHLSTYIQEDRVSHLKRAIAAFDAVLVYWTPEEAPLDHARAQHNLGEAYHRLAEAEDRIGNLELAISAFKAALVYATLQNAPERYAATQHSLGSVYIDLARLEDQAGNLKRALVALNAALTYYTASAFPSDYGATQQGLGNAYSDLAKVEDRAGNLERALTAYKNALPHCEPEITPLNCAVTHFSLGNVYVELAQVKNRTRNLKRATDAFKAALVYYTPEIAPWQYSMTQYHLGETYYQLLDLTAAIPCWREAERYYRQADRPDIADRVLHLIGLAEKHLSAGLSRRILFWVLRRIVGPVLLWVRNVLRQRGR